jgi:hypothetical protein
LIVVNRCLSDKEALGKRQAGIEFHLCIYGERNNGKVPEKYLFYNVDTLRVLFKSKKHYNEKGEGSISKEGRVNF